MIALLGLLAAAHAAPSPFGVPTRWLDALRRAEFTSVDRQMVHASHTCSLRVDADCDGADPACATWESGALADLATAVLIGENDEDRAGGSVAMADVDGDGWDDYIVTASQHSGTGYKNGAVYSVPSPVYGEVDLGTVATRIDGMPDGEVLQETIVGDANGDGFADLLVADVASAEVYLLHGPLSGATTTASAALTLNAYDELNWWSLGASLDMADLDGDGLAELVLGVPGEGGPGAPVPRERGGYVQPRGVDGYGRAELVVGARGIDGETTLSGAVFVFSDLPTGTLSLDAASATFTGSNEDGAGTALALGDVRGTGVLDVLVGAFYEGPGRAYILSVE
jgi:hypothetical protein